MAPLVDRESVQKVWEEQSEMDFFQVEKWIAKLSREQPTVLAYLMSANDEEYNFEEKQLLLYLGVAIWRMLLEGGAKTPEVTLEYIEAAQQKNIEMIEYLEEEIPGDFDKTVQAIFANYHQKYILEYVLSAVFEDDSESAKIRPKSKGLLFFDLKTVLDCLDQ